MNQKFWDLIEAARAQQYPYKIQAGASAQALEDLVRRASQELDGYAPPAFLLDFLRTTDGMDRNGFQLYGTKTHEIAGFESRADLRIMGLVEANLLWRDYPPNKEYVYLAESGDVLYCHNLTNGRFEIVDRITNEIDDETNSFETCDQLVEKLLNHMLNRYNLDDDSAQA